MKSMRIPLIAAIAVALLGIILGSFFDLGFSQAVGANANHTGGLVISVIGPTVGFAALSFVGGGYLGLGLRKENATWQKVVFIGLSVLCLGVSTYFAGQEWFGDNGFYKAAPSIVGYLISLVVLAGVEVGGYFFLRDTKHPYAWLIYAVILAVAFMALVPGTTALKAIFHRPRLRAVEAYEGITFHNWWEACKNYKDLMAQYGLASEEFKSFPSGHSCEIGLLLVAATFLPMVSEKIEKHQYLIFFVCFFLCLVVMAGRILAAAHFLSDVSMGLMLDLLFAFIGNEILVHIKKLHPEESKALEEPKALEAQ